MAELLELNNPALTSEVIHYLLNGQPLPVDLCIKLRTLGIDPIRLQNQYDI